MNYGVSIFDQPRSPLPPAKPFILAVLAILAVLLFWVWAKAEEINLTASWYSVKSLKKEGTWKTSKGVCADGSIFSNNDYTCATRLFPLGSTLRVTNKNNSKSVIVRVTDRIGKRFATKRVDLSKLAFNAIAELKTGIIPVKVEKCPEIALKTPNRGIVEASGRAK